MVKGNMLDTSRDGVAAAMRFGYQCMEVLDILLTGQLPFENMKPEFMDSVGQKVLRTAVSVSATSDHVQPDFTRELKREIFETVYGIMSSEFSDSEEE